MTRKPRRVGASPPVGIGSQIASFNSTRLRLPTLLRMLHVSREMQCTSP
jgi:hypothetical protein